MKKPSFEKYVCNRDGQEEISEGLFSKSDPNAPGWTAPQAQKNQYAANTSVVKALPGFLKEMEKLGKYATAENATNMGAYIVKLGQNDPNNFLNKEIANVSGKKAPLSQWLKSISSQFQKDLFNNTKFADYNQFKEAFQAIKAVEEQHKKIAYPKFVKMMQMAAAGLRQTISKEHGPEAHKTAGAPALDAKGQANVAGQKQGLGSKIGSGIGSLFGRG